MTTSLPNDLDTVNFIARCSDSGITRYTAVQIFVATDEWQAAHDEYNAALETAGKIDATFGGGLIAGLDAYRSNENYRKFCDATSKATEFVDDYCPLGCKMRNHSSESFPVDKALKIAAQLRNATRQINKAVEVYNKAVR